MTKLHLGCGSVYLTGYVNIAADPGYLANCCPPGLLEQNTTTLDKYYKHSLCSKPREVVADVRCDLLDPLPFANGTVSHVVIYQVLEHLSQDVVGGVLDEIARVLRPMGEMRVSVPDVKQTAKLLAESTTPEQEDWAIRLLHGSQRSVYSHHYCGYTRRTLEALLLQHGFSQVSELESINDYPAIHLLALRGGTP